MADRALFAAFQKVRGDLEGALAQTRKKEEETRAREEAERLRMRREGFSKQAAAAGASALVRGGEKKKPKPEAPKPVPSPAPAEPRRLSKTAAAGAFGSLLADAANSAGAVFRSADALKSEAEQQSTRANGAGKTLYGRAV